ncbi:hypothetical protein EVAR_86182_1 [Eumeta japonica]|uniref:Uncharacterized protein n=1 Tax=Eumeta variegata TaxID=151549 RepID=A0A4C1UCF4_EUMVA|nr:hypothetical protein EVAR_86182_1 [Eumeta japonica]
MPINSNNQLRLVWVRQLGKRRLLSVVGPLRGVRRQPDGSELKEGYENVNNTQARDPRRTSAHRIGVALRHHSNNPPFTARGARCLPPRLSGASAPACYKLLNAVLPPPLLKDGNNRCTELVIDRGNLSNLRATAHSGLTTRLSRSARGARYRRLRDGRGRGPAPAAPLKVPDSIRALHSVLQLSHQIIFTTTTTPIGKDDTIRWIRC